MQKKILLRIAKPYIKVLIACF
jgi:hypothetical protein